MALAAQRSSTAAQRAAEAVLRRMKSESEREAAQPVRQCDGARAAQVARGEAFQTSSKEVECTGERGEESDEHATQVACIWRQDRIQGTANMRRQDARRS